VTINTSLSSSTGLSTSFSSAALYSFSTKKTIALEDYCSMALANKLPKVLTKVLFIHSLLLDHLFFIYKFK
jgi:hypothetical protein